MSDYSIIHIDDSKDSYEGTDVPGEFRPLSKLLDCEQVGITFLRIPAHSDFEQGTGHYHDEIEEIYIITKDVLTMRFGDDIKEVAAGSAVRVAPKTPRSHRNEGEEDVEMWAVSKRLGRADHTKIDDFWEASDKAKQTR